MGLPRLCYYPASNRVVCKLGEPTRLVKINPSPVSRTIHQIMIIVDMPGMCVKVGRSVEIACVVVPQVQPYVLVTIVPFLAKMIIIVGNAVRNAHLACIVQVEHAELVPPVVLQIHKEEWERKDVVVMDVVVHVADAVITRYAPILAAVIAFPSNLADPQSFYFFM